MKKLATGSAFALVIGFGFYLGAVVFFFSGCATSDSLENTDSALTQAQSDEIQSVKEEIAIGRSMAAKILGTYSLLERKPLVQKYVRLLGASMVKQFGRPEIQYHFAVLDSDDANAFATPGGYIFVTKGLIRLLQDEAELAGVLAHELVHINHRHMYQKVREKRQVSSGETISRILSRGAGDIGRSIGAAVTSGMKALLEEGLTQDNEFDADQTAVVYLATMGYEVTGFKKVIERLAEHKGQTVFSKTHPPFADRLVRLEKTIATDQLDKSVREDRTVTMNRFNRVKRTL